MSGNCHVTMSCSTVPQFTDWNDGTYKKLVYSTGVSNGANFLDYGSYVDPSSDPTTTMPTGFATAENQEPCYLLFLNPNDEMMYALPNPAAKGTRTDCVYNEYCDGTDCYLPSDGTLWTQDNFPYEDCMGSLSGTTALKDCNTESSVGISCLKNCKMGYKYETPKYMVNDGQYTARFQLTDSANSNVRLGQWVYSPTGYSYSKDFTGSQPISTIFNGKYSTLVFPKGTPQIGEGYKIPGSAAQDQTVLTFDMVNPMPVNIGRSAVVFGSDLNDPSIPIDEISYQAITAAPQILDEDNAMRCCAGNPQDPNWQETCSGTLFDNSKGNSGSCATLFQGYCGRNWSGVNSCPNGTLCNNFINTPNSTFAINNTLYNYITSKNRSGIVKNGVLSDGTVPSGANSPQDYISYSQRTSGGTTPSDVYYANHNCSLRKNYSCDSNGSYSIDDVCCRDDAIDPFFTQAIPKMLGSNPNAGTSIMPYFCQQFTRADLANDTTLRNICGCYLSQGTTVYGAPVASLNSQTQMVMQGTPQTTSQYYSSIVQGPGCDPVCQISDVQN